MSNREISKRIADARDGSNKQLWLSGLGLTSVPAEVWELADLEVLGLDGNQLTTLSEGVGNLARLHRLYLDGNRLTQLPKEIGKLASLKELDLSGNQLAELPKEIGSLSNLRGLNLTDNQLTELPKAIGNLAELYYLRLTNNRLSALPKEIGKLANLRGLHLTSNHLTVLPERIGDLSELVDLCLQRNRLTKLPQGIGRLAALRELYIANNPLPMGMPHPAEDRPLRGDELARLRNYLRGRTTLSMSPNGALEIEQMGQGEPRIPSIAGATDDDTAFNTVVAIEVLTEPLASGTTKEGDRGEYPRTARHDSIFHSVGQGLFYCGRVLEPKQEREFSYVFDCGAESRGRQLSEQVRACLDRTNHHLDLVVLSHLHWDHVSGVKELLEGGEVERVVLPYLPPAERLYVGSESMKNAAYRDDRDGDWYREFLVRPGAFLRSLGARQISFIHGDDGSGDGDDGGDGGRAEPASRAVGRPDNLGNASPLQRDQVTRILEEEKRFDSRDQLDADQLFGSRFMAYHGRWEFSILGFGRTDPSIEALRAKVRRICGNGGMDVVLSDDTSLKLVRHAHSGLFSAKHWNHRSLAMCCRRLPERPQGRYTRFESGVSPSNRGMRPCLTERDGPFCPAFLLTGDLPVKEVWDDFARKFELDQSPHGKIVPLVYQVPRHGSREGWNELQRDSLDDGVFVLSARTENRHGHPHPEVLRSLLEENRPVFWVNESRCYAHRLQIRFTVPPPTTVDLRGS